MERNVNSLFLTLVSLYAWCSKKSIINLHLLQKIMRLKMTHTQAGVLLFVAYFCKLKNFLLIFHVVIFAYPCMIHYPIPCRTEMFQASNQDAPHLHTLQCSQLLTSTSSKQKRSHSSPKRGARVVPHSVLIRKHGTTHTQRWRNHGLGVCDDKKGWTHFQGHRNASYNDVMNPSTHSLEVGVEFVIQ